MTLAPTNARQNVLVLRAVIGWSLKCSHIWQISIITPRTRSSCASIFVIYSWWYCRKSTYRPWACGRTFSIPISDSCPSLSRSLPIQLSMRDCFLTGTETLAPCALGCVHCGSAIQWLSIKPVHPHYRLRERHLTTGRRELQLSASVWTLISAHKSVAYNFTLS